MTSKAGQTLTTTTGECTRRHVTPHAGFELWRWAGFLQPARQDRAVFAARRRLAHPRASPTGLTPDDDLFWHPPLRSSNPTAGPRSGPTTHRSRRRRMSPIPKKAQSAETNVPRNTGPAALPTLGPSPFAPPGQSVRRVPNLASPLDFPTGPPTRYWFFDLVRGPRVAALRILARQGNAVPRQFQRTHPRPVLT